jgi:Zn-dependent peptidase ImmA (M78 family)
MFHSLTFSDVEFLLFVSLGLISTGILLFLYNILSQIISNANKATWITNVPISTLIMEVILFTNDLLYRKGIRYFPKFKVSYYRHKKNMGVLKGSEIIVYCKNHDNIPELVDTVLHEVAHYVQKCTDPQAFNRTNSTTKGGRVDNSLEKEACQFAEEWVGPCMNYLLKREIIRKTR